VSSEGTVEETYTQLRPLLQVRVVFKGNSPDVNFILGENHTSHREIITGRLGLHTTVYSSMGYLH